ncbi:alkylmercury lyase family protein [Streptomyces sp. 21So2-11]|uniref:alkylmercury lyase family protein n=1 Tax=Streptomyces sp. 21So2-11 TaxID=3144408 RepID=UPI0032190AF2
MIIELRSVPDCPNLPPARDLLRACLAELGLPLSITEVVGAYPSPSVLVDGVDVMGTPAGGSSSCRLDVPTTDAIRAALRRAIAERDGSACCEGGPIRADRPHRAADLPAELREVYRSVLRHFATTGTAPAHADLAVPAGIDPADALARLAALDLLAIDEGRLVAAYPFSPTPTGHVVRLGAVSVHAMCAIDALGMSAMLGQDTVITSTDPHTGEPVRVTTSGIEAAFTPADAVVVYAASGATGRSVDTCCTTINFFASQDSADAWITTRPHLTATVLDQRSAVVLGRDIFGPLLS